MTYSSFPHHSGFSNKNAFSVTYVEVLLDVYNAKKKFQENDIFCFWKKMALQIFYNYSLIV